MMQKRQIQIYNRKARFDYEISESFEAGIVLSGDEIKAIRQGRVNLTGSYIKILGGEASWVGGMINVLNGDTQRSRKVLLHREEINRLIGKTEEHGLTLLPLKLYLKRGRAKLEVGLGRGMKKYDKRKKLKERDIERDARQSENY